MIQNLKKLIMLLSGICAIMNAVFINGQTDLKALSKANASSKHEVMPQVQVRQCGLTER